MRENTREVNEVIPVENARTNVKDELDETSDELKNTYQERKFVGQRRKIKVNAGFRQVVASNKKKNKKGG